MSEIKNLLDLIPATIRPAGRNWMLYNDDCRDVLASLPDASVDAVVTDPPYSERTHAGHDALDGTESMRKLGYGFWTEADARHYCSEFARVARGWVVVMTDHMLAPTIADALSKAGRYVFAPLPFFAPGSRVRLAGDGPSSWTIWIVVARTTAQSRWGTLPGGYLAGEGWRERTHMGGKPTKLMLEIVRDYSRDGDLILDPFAGSGTTGVAALRMGRRFIGVERDPEFHRAATRRLEAESEPKLF